MSEKQENQAFLDSIQAELERSCDRLDGHTLSRLNTIRHAALAHYGARRPRPLLAPFGGLVAASLIAAAVLLMDRPAPGPAGDPSIPDQAFEDMEILTSGDNLEFYEDFEFYQWLAENDVSI